MSRLLAFLCLLSVANCEDFGISSSKRMTSSPYLLTQVVEDVEWRQPVCVVPAQDAPPCFLALQQLHNEYSQIDKQFSEDDVTARLRVKKASEVPEKINLDEIEPSSLAEDSVEIRVKSTDGSTPSLDVNNEKVEISDKRSRELPIEERPLPISVTKVMISPVTATIVAQHCLPDIGVPLCEEYQMEQILTSRQNEPIKPPLEVPVLGLKNKLPLFKLFSDFFSKWKSTSNVTSSATVSNLDGVVSLDVEAATDGDVTNIDQHTEIPTAFVDSEPTVIELLADDLSHKKDIITQAIANKKEHVAETVSSLAAMKEGIVQGIVDKTEQVAEAVTAAQQGFVQGIVDTKNKVIEAATTVKQAIEQGIADKKEQVANTIASIHVLKQSLVKEKPAFMSMFKHNPVETMETIKTLTWQRMVQDVAQTFVNDINEKYQRARDLKNLVLGAIIDTMNRKKESLRQLEQDTWITIAKKHEMMMNISRAIVDSVLDAVQKKKEAVEGATQHAKDFAVNTATKKYQLLKEFKNMVINAVLEVNGIKHKALGRVSEAMANATAAKKEAIAHTIDEAKNHYRKLVAISYKTLQGILDEKTNWLLDLANKKQELIQSITDSKVGIINATSSKKQGTLKHIIDKKIDAIKKLSEKTQEFISAASLAVPLLISTIKQHVGLNQARSRDDQMVYNEGSGDDFGFAESAEINERLTETKEAQETNDTASTDTSANATDPAKLMTRKDDSGYFDEVDSADESIPEMDEIMSDAFPVDDRPASRMFPRFPALYSLSPVPGYETKQSPNSELGLLGVVQTVTNKKFAIIAYKLEQINKIIEKILNVAGLSMQPPTARNETTTRSSVASAANDLTTVKPPVNTSAAADTSVPGLPANLGLPAQLGGLPALVGLPAAGGQQPVPGLQAMPALQVLAGLQALSSMFPNSPSLPSGLPTQPPRTEELADYDPVDEEGASSSGQPTPKPQLPWVGNLALPSFNDQANAGSNQLQEHFDDIVELDPEASSHSENVFFDPTPNEWTQGANVSELNNGTAEIDDEEPGIEIVYRPETRSSSTRPESSTIGQDNKPDDEKPIEIVHSGPVVHDYSHIESLSSTTPSEMPSPQDSIVAAEDPTYDAEEEEEEEEKAEPCLSCQMHAQFAFPAKASRKNVTSEAEAAEKTNKKTTTL